MTMRIVLAAALLGGVAMLSAGCLSRLPEKPGVLATTKPADDGDEGLTEGGITFNSRLPLRVVAYKAAWWDTDTDAGLIHLKAFTGLKSLTLTSTSVTGTGLKSIDAVLTGLRELRLNNPQFTDAGMEYLQPLTELRELDLGGTKIKDAGFANLTGLTGLRRLGLRGTQVNDAGLVHLKGLTGLQSLDLRGTKVTDAGVSDLQKALPNTKIIR